MGELGDAVYTLLDAFTSGLTIIKSVRQRRKDAKAKVTTEIKAEELKLRRSLKKSKTDVSKAYSQDLDRFGPKFAQGDGNAHSSLTAILFRLNAGFVTIIDRFTRGKSTKADYQNLVSLSNASRKEAISTFNKLSSRLSQASDSVKSRPNSSTKTNPKTRGSSTGRSPKPGASAPKTKNSSDLTLRPTKSVTKPTDRSKSKDKHPRVSTGSTKESSGKRKIPSDKETQPSPQLAVQSYERLPFIPQSTNFSKGQRMSMMTFASGSTKLGEIPERKRIVESFEYQDPMAGTAFPLAPYREPEKPRSRFMKLFRR